MPFGKKAIIDPTRPQVCEHERMAVTKEELAKLRFLFWHYLNSKTRAGLLFRADMIPSIPLTTLPQTVEGTIINKHANDPKLGHLWLLMQPLLPKNRRHLHHEHIGHGKLHYDRVYPNRKPYIRKKPLKPKAYMKGVGIEHAPSVAHCREGSD